jgi:NAD+ kinase
MKRIGILYHPMNKAAHSLAQELESFLSPRGISVWLCSAWERDAAQEQLDGTDLIVTSGGDGTILRAAQIATTQSIPITGVNLGKLGFMAELSPDLAKDKLTTLIAGEGWIDERAMLEAELYLPDIEIPSLFYSLNDVVMARSEIPRVVCIEVSIDSELLTSYLADGVIVATATGSTGYALSAGGPVLHPQAKEFLLVPILPHLGFAYSLVLQATTVLKLGVSTVRQATLSIDGHINLPLLTGATIKVKQSARRARFLRVHPESSFYSSLERKLSGKRVVE